MGPATAQRSLPEPPTDSSIRNTLRLGSPELVVALIEDLGVRKDIAEQYREGHEGEEKFAWLSLRPINGAEARALFLPCGIQGAAVFLLTQSKTGWVVRGEETFDCHYDNRVSIRSLYLTSRQQYDLLIGHACVAHGTGYVEQHTLVFRIASSGFKRVFDRTDYLMVDVPVGSRTKQNSVFQPLGFGVLEETRDTWAISGDDGEDIPASLGIQRRMFRWSASLKKFQSSPFRRLR